MNITTDYLMALPLLAGVHVSSATPRDLLAAQIHSLRPIKGGVDLVRLGPAGDGGYLVPDDMKGIDYAFSPGVADESGFELELASRDMKVFLADGSIERLPASHQNFTFDKKFIGGFSSDKFITLDDWKTVRIGDYGADLLLQMDVEGAEFEALIAASSALLSQFRIMVIEFHRLQHLFSRPFFDIASSVFSKILETHSVVHIHPNNCCGAIRSKGMEIPRVAEFTFLRKDRVRDWTAVARFPHPLDVENTSNRPLPLHECWYR